MKAIRAEIKSNSISRTTRCRYYKAWYAEQCDKSELAAIFKRNVAAHRRWIELKPDSMDAHASLGSVYAALEKWDEAKKELEKACTASNRIDFTLAKVELRVKGLNGKRGASGDIPLRNAVDGQKRFFLRDNRAALIIL